MSLHWYACISTNTCCFEMHHISLETDWWALPNASLIVWIRSAIHEILADKAFTATDVLISQLFVVTFVHPTYVQIALIWGFPAQLSLWKSVHLLWRYKLNKVCDKSSRTIILYSIYYIYLSYPKLQNTSNFNMTSNPHSYLALFVLKTLLVVWYFIIDLIPSKVHSYLLRLYTEFSPLQIWTPI